MLLKIRDIATGWLAALIVAILIIPFAFFGIDYYFNQSTEPYVAKVNDNEIKQSYFQRALANYHQQMQNALGTSVDADDPFIKQQTLNRIIDSEVLNQVTQDAGLNVSNEGVLETIRQFDIFHDSEGFDADLYQRSITSQGMPPAVFEQQVKLDMMSEQLQAAISESSFTTEKELENIVRLKKQSRNFSYALVSLNSIKEKTEVTSEEIENYYEQNKTSFKRPKQVKVDYLKLTFDKVMEQIKLSDDDLENYFTNNQLAYNDPEKRKIWQIKIGKPENATDEQLQTAKAKAEELLKATADGLTFEKIAETMSSTSEEGIKVDVSETGFKKQGELLKVIDDVIFSLNKGETSDIIEDLNAYFIVNVSDIEEMREVSFDEVKDQVETDLKTEKAQKMYFELADQMAALSYEHPDTLEVASDAVDIPVETSNYFSQDSVESNPDFSNPKVVAASFSEDVLTNGNNSDVIELSDTEAIVVRVTDVIEEGQQTMSEVSTQIVDALKNTKAKNTASEIGDKILSALKKGESVDSILSEHGLAFKQAEEVTRDDITVNRSVLRTAFRLEPPIDDQPAVSGTELGNGDYVVVSLKSVQYPEKIMGIDVDNQSKEMQRVRAESDWANYFDALKDSSDITIVESNL